MLRGHGRNASTHPHPEGILERRSSARPALILSTGPFAYSAPPQTCKAGSYYGRLVSISSGQPARRLKQIVNAPLGGRSIRKEPVLWSFICPVPALAEPPCQPTSQQWPTSMRGEARESTMSLNVWPHAERLRATLAAGQYFAPIGPMHL